MWVNQQWSVQCLSRYNGTSAATSPKMVCQSTCLDYAASERALVNSTTLCPGIDRTNGTREFQLNKDYVDCTDWSTLQTNRSETCVSGESNEPNCGFGSSTEQLCGFCSGSQPDECCYQGESRTVFRAVSLLNARLDRHVGLRLCLASPTFLFYLVPLAIFHLGRRNIRFPAKRFILVLFWPFRRSNRRHCRWFGTRRIFHDWQTRLAVLVVSTPTEAKGRATLKRSAFSSAKFERKGFDRHERLAKWDEWLGIESDDGRRYIVWR